MNFFHQRGQFLVIFHWISANICKTEFQRWTKIIIFWWFLSQIKSGRSKVIVDNFWANGEVHVPETVKFPSTILIQDRLLLFKPHDMFIWDFTLIFGLGPCQWQMLTTKNVGQPLLDGTKITFTDFRLYRAEYERIIEHLKYRESWRGLTNLNWSKVIWMKNWNLHRNTRSMRSILQTHTVYWLNKRTLTGLLNSTSRSTIEALRLKLNENVSSDEFLFGGMFIWIWNIVIGTEE